MVTTIKLTDKEEHAIIIALSNLDAILESGGDAFGGIERNLRSYMKANGVDLQDVKELLVRFGVDEAAVYQAGQGLQ